MKFLLGDSFEAKALREKYIFYIVPMLNIEGVIHGNHRTDIAGYDLNRKWLEPSPFICPVIYACKFLVEKIRQERMIDLFCDMHSHFQAIGAFMYCNTWAKDGAVSPMKQSLNAELRVIPYMLS